ncbi:MAG TPA: PKD domain-containing protein [Bryobacteraceae bacterium]|nr:PKD domain-containing protein [Bryobacteraceae bacterium]
MKQNRVRQLAMPLLAVVFTIGAIGMFDVPIAEAQSGYTYDADAVQKGLSISPVPLNFAGRDRNQVGYGSYLVNAMGGCNDCHTNPNYSADGDPFKGMPKKINVAGYMAGGIAFGPFTSRNITPSVEGPVTGSLTNFKALMRTGVDLRKLHPQISTLLQVMPWPVYQDLADRDLDAIFAFLSSIPCVEGGPEEKPNRCGTPAGPTAVAGPKDLTTFSNQIQLDGTKSASTDGSPLKYRWSNAAGSAVAALSNADTATPIVQFPTGPAPYIFDLTVTDSAGRSATDKVTVNFARTAF